MTFKNLLKISAGAVGAVAIAMPAQAASFTGFAFDTYTDFNNNPKEDIFLKSVSHGTRTVTEGDFSLVTGATVRFNGDPVLGPSSTDLGDEANGPNGAGATETPNGQQVASFLGNLNLNNIVDTEDNGISTFDLAFDGPVNTFYFFERGINSAFTVQALDDAGNELGDAIRIGQALWSEAGYAIDTTEIVGAQNVGSYGLRFDEAISNIRIISQGSVDNGPDYKVVAAQVPEPGSMAALALAGGLAMVAKRRKQSTAA